MPKETIIEVKKEFKTDVSGKHSYETFHVVAQVDGKELTYPETYYEFDRAQAKANELLIEFSTDGLIETPIKSPELADFDFFA